MSDAPTPPPAASSEASQPNAFARGFRIMLEGIELAFDSPDVTRAYLKVTAIIFSLSLLLSGTAIWALWHYAVPAPDASWFVGAALWLVRVLGALAALLAGPLISIGIINLAFPLFPKGVFLAGLQEIDPERAARLAAKAGMPTGVAMGIAARRLAKFVSLSLLCALVGLIPVVGTVAGVTGQLLLSSRTLGWDLLDPYFDSLDIRHAEQREFVDRHRRALLGFSLPLALVFAVPILGPLLFGFAQAAGALFVARELPVDPREYEAQSLS